MDEMEFLLFFVFGFFTLRFLFKWYRALFGAWPKERYTLARRVMGALPIIAFVILLYTTVALAAFDVVDSLFFIVFYLLMGFTWISCCMSLMGMGFDLSWQDDALGLGNQAVVPAIAGGFIGLTLIYAGANIGDGPGWWCVIFAAGLGLIAWLALGRITNSLTNVFERISVERDTGCGMRFGCYLLASGIILGRASGGDWTSGYMTIVEFLTSFWPVLPLTLLVILVERYYISRGHSDGDGDQSLASSAIWGAIYLLSMIVAVQMLPAI